MTPRYRSVMAVFSSPITVLKVSNVGSQLRTPQQAHDLDAYCLRRFIHL